MGGCGAGMCFPGMLKERRLEGIRCRNQPSSCYFITRCDIISSSTFESITVPLVQWDRLRSLNSVNDSIFSYNLLLCNCIIKSLCSSPPLLYDQRWVSLFFAECLFYVKEPSPRKSITTSHQNIVTCPVLLVQRPS